MDIKSNDHMLTRALSGSYIRFNDLTCFDWPTSFGNGATLKKTPCRLNRKPLRKILHLSQNFPYNQIEDLALAQHELL